ncbi:hypothetical protein MNBD_GAMMA09-1638 [hydrothermal vent metagenome]|uniref:Peptidase S8/S53 domain-containing protein n=1 Tax=hydrothermal vent metagenome TaxID=652676 RepID=A0A3B0XLD6_9ZZZZ
MRDLPLYISLYLLILLTSCTGQTGEESSSSNAGLRYTISGTITGLNGSLRLQTNNVTLTTRNNGSFSFQGNFIDGSNYNITVALQPTGQLCSVNNAIGSINSANVSNITITCIDYTFSISGNISSTVLTVVDSDINDPGSQTNISNNTAASAQIINNLSTVHGFASLNGTNRTGDRFAQAGDPSDYYQLNLQQAQTITLQAVDFSGTETLQGDLDLFLMDANSNIVAQDTAGTEFKSITVPSDNFYYILVAAASGSSKYTLRLNSANTAGLSSPQSADFVPGELMIKFRQNLSINNFSNANTHLTLSHHNRSRASLAQMDTANTSLKLFSHHNNTNNSTPEFLHELKSLNFTSYEKIITLREIKRLNSQTDIEYAEPNYIYHALRVPNDDFYNRQWNYPAINLPQAWDITTGTPPSGNVIVAIVDTGVFLNHSDLTGKLTPGYDFISNITNANDGDGRDSNPDDPGDNTQAGKSSWHGTHVAGIVAANTNNRTGVAGVSWGAKIMPLRVLGTQGGNSSDIIEAIRYASGLSNRSNRLPAQKADIINLSLGGPGFSQSMQNTFNAARAAGVIVIAAAGNDNSSTLFYPASYDGVTSVSATDFLNEKAPYSNFGSRIDIAAPGGNQRVDLNNDSNGDGILSTLVNETSASRSSAFVFYQGTSMASPHVAGVAALMRAVYPTLTPDEFDNALRNGKLTNEAGDAGRDDIYGYGVIDALKAVQEAQRLSNGGTPPTTPAIIVATPSSLVLNLQNTAQLNISNQSSTPASITGFSDNASWLTVTENTVDANKLGSYNITINRNGLNNAIYNGTITFNLSTGEVLSVQVSMLVGNISTNGDIGLVYLLLIDSASGNVINSISPASLGNGNYSYIFNSVPNGSYQIIGGSDIDNDQLICQPGENCGGFPVVSALQDIPVSGADVTRIDFNIDIVSSVTSVSIPSQNKATSNKTVNNTPLKQPAKPPANNN